MGTPDGVRTMTEGKRAVAHETMFLDHTVSRFFGTDRYLIGLRRKLMAKGVVRVGQLVQMTKEELLAAAPRTAPGVIERVNARLANVDLQLGMIANGWKNPDTVGCKKKVRRAAHLRSARGSVIRRAPRATLG
ncbi:MAG: hypothetical protein QOJ84_744 [Bradyrhizobium sp.]|jgi:hypothetical protein|nr:hypothetical protein [Bradyrhizobium sp.]